MSTDQIIEWLSPYQAEVSVALASQLASYLELLLRWNAKTNLTSIRDPQAIVERHFGESLFAAQFVPTSVKTMLDLGSGAGFPGLPIALARPELRVTLAESQGKKVAFLREALRVLGLDVAIWPRRVELMPDEHRFDVVTLRAVDESDAALLQARRRVEAGGTLLHLTSGLQASSDAIAMPGSQKRVVLVERFA